MALADSDFNAFAHGLAERFSDRATGQDSDSTRLLNIRPSDHVLAGFLTPCQHEESGANSEEELADDLPLDRPYEQTALGMHWRIPRAALRSGIGLSATIRLQVYVRRLPTHQEQS